MPPLSQFALVVVGEEGEARVGTIANADNIATQHTAHPNLPKFDATSKQSDVTDGFLRYKKQKEVYLALLRT